LGRGSNQKEKVEERDFEIFRKGEKRESEQRTLDIWKMSEGGGEIVNI